MHPLPPSSKHCLPLHHLPPTSNAAQLLTSCNPLPTLLISVLPATLFQHCSLQLPSTSNAVHLYIHCNPLPVLLISASPVTHIQCCPPLHPLSPSYNAAHLYTPCIPLPMLLTSACPATLFHRCSSLHPLLTSSKHCPPRHPLPPSSNTVHLCAHLPLQSC